MWQIGHMSHLFYLLLDELQQKDFSQIKDFSSIWKCNNFETQGHDIIQLSHNLISSARGYCTYILIGTYSVPIYHQIVPIKIFKWTTYVVQILGKLKEENNEMKKKEVNLSKGFYGATQGSNPSSRIDFTVKFKRKRGVEQSKISW